VKNQRMLRDMADRPGTVSGRSDAGTLALLPVKSHASSIHPKNVRGIEDREKSPHEWSNVAELKLHLNGLPILFRFTLDEVSAKTLLGAVATDASLSQLPQTMLRVGPLELNLLDRTAKRGERQIDLRPREFRLLRYMMDRSDELLTRARLLQEVWNYKFVPQTNLVDVHMGRLRRKIDGPNEPAMIRSVRGSGFVLNANPLTQN
jgi:DNA-binding winged helix-turn-helix (wHTH) protein